jgi:hypothetical protein
MSNIFSYTIKLYSSINNITLPNNLNNVKKIKIKKLMYKFLNYNQRVLTISINNYSTNQYFDGITSGSYTTSFFNDGNINSLLNYYNTSDEFDVIFEYGMPMISFDLTVKVDNVETADISFDNPILIDLQFFSN